MASKLGERRKRQNAIKSTYKISALDNNKSFKMCYRDVNMAKEFPNLLVAYQILNSSWYVFKNDPMGNEIYFCNLASRKFYALDAFLMSSNVPGTLKAVVTHAFGVREEMMANE